MKEITTPQGTRDSIMNECYTRKQLQLELEERFSRWGYQEVITPMIEYYNTFRMADMKEEEMYKILDASGRILTLRPDMTIPIARVAATKFKDATLPLRFYYSSNVFKVNEELSGNKNERSDCGVELIGIDEEHGDLEILSCALDALSILGDTRYTLEIGNLNFFRCACMGLNLEQSQQDELADLIDRKSLKSLEDFVSTLDINEEMRTFFLKLPWLCGDASILCEARRYAFNDTLKAIIDRLEELCSQLVELGGMDTLTIDLGKIPRLHYYTGLSFEAFVEGVGISVLSGGRYDQLLERFGKALPAVGFAMRLDALQEVATRVDNRKRVVLEYSFDHLVQALQEAQILRKESIVELRHNEVIKGIQIREEEK